MLHYQYLRFWLMLGMRAWYKRMYIKWHAPLPTDGPIIFASTHPNSAVDYLMAPLFAKQPVHVLVRGDVFEKPALNRFFRWIFMLPVYRMRDGFSSLSKNQQSFEECFKFFDRKGKVLIFSEGICIQKKILQPIRKGTARLALDYINKHGGKKLYVVPLASNYTRYRSFRASVMVQFGEAIEVSKYSDLFQENANKAYEALTADIARALENQFIIQPEYDDHSLTERALMALRLNRSSHQHKWIVEDSGEFEQEYALTKAIRNDGDYAWSNELKELAIQPTQEGLLSNTLGTWFYRLQLIFLTPVIALGWLSVAVPYLLSRYIIRTKIKDIIFDNTVTVMGSTVFYILFWHGLLLISLLVWGWWGLTVPLLWLLVTKLGIELVDDYIFAHYNLKHLRQRDRFERLYESMVADLGVKINP